MKFGGTSVATLPRWQNIRELVASRRAEGARVLIVVSALSGITDALRQLCGQGDRGQRNDGRQASSCSAITICSNTCSWRCRTRSASGLAS